MFNSQEERDNYNRIINEDGKLLAEVIASERKYRRTLMEMIQNMPEPKYYSDIEKYLKSHNIYYGEDNFFELFNRVCIGDHTGASGMYVEFVCYQTLVNDYALYPSVHDIPYELFDAVRQIVFDAWNGILILFNAIKDTFAYLFNVPSMVKDMVAEKRYQEDIKHLIQVAKYHKEPSRSNARAALAEMGIDI